jgi:polyisoprenoid-binding protein YceI
MLTPTEPVLTPTLPLSVRRFGLLWGALVLAACAKDPTQGKTAATVGEAQTAGAVAATAETLSVSADSSKIGFVGAKVTAQHVGHFGDFGGTISLVADTVEKSRVEFNVKVASLSVDGGPDSLVGHLKSPDFFDVAKYPSARFVSTAIRAGSDVAGANYTVTGNLEIRGTTKSVTFPATITMGPDTVQVKTEFGINRKDFGIVYPGMKDDLIKDNVLIRVDLLAPRAKHKT